MIVLKYENYIKLRGVHANETYSERLNQFLLFSVLYLVLHKLSHLVCFLKYVHMKTALINKNICMVIK